MPRQCGSSKLRRSSSEPAEPEMAPTSNRQVMPSSSDPELESKNQNTMNTVSPQTTQKQQFEDIVRHIIAHTHLSPMKIVTVESKYHFQYAKVCRDTAKELRFRENVLIHWCVVANGKPLDLIRWLHYDVEFVIDGSNGRVGITGKPENIQRMMEACGLVPHTYRIVRKTNAST